MSTEMPPGEPVQSRPALSDLDALVINVSSRAKFWGGEQSEVSWNLTIDVESEDEDDDHGPVFWMDGWTFHLMVNRDLRDWLDEVDADTEVFSSIVTSDGLIDELHDVAGANLLLINHVWVDPRWRGRGGVGLFLTGIGIKQLWADAACVALHPSPYELRRQYPNGEVPEDVWQAGVARLTTLWQDLGFWPLNGNLVLDPTLNDLDRALERLATNLGITYMPDSWAKVEIDFDDEEEAIGD